MSKICLLTVSLFLILTSCDENAVDTDVEPVDVQATFRNLQPLPQFINNTIAMDEDFESADILLINISSPEAVQYGVQPGNKTFSDIFAIAEYPSALNNIYFDEFPMNFNFVALGNIHYTHGENWDRLKFDFGKNYFWKLHLKRGDTIPAQTSIPGNIHPFALSVDEEIKLGESVNMIWNKSEGGEDLYLNFIFTKSTGETIEITGPQLEDTGQFGFSSQYLQDLGIDGEGLLTLRFIRIGKNKALIDLPPDEGAILLNYRITSSDIRIPVTK